MHLFGLIMIMGLYYGVLLWTQPQRKFAQNLKKARKLWEIFLKKIHNAQAEPLFKELNILSIYKQKTFAILQFMWKLYSNNISENIGGLFQLRQRIYGANNLKYLVPNVNLDNTKKQFIVSSSSSLGKITSWSRKCENHIIF